MASVIVEPFTCGVHLHGNPLINRRRRHHLRRRPPRTPRAVASAFGQRSGRALDWYTAAAEMDAPEQAVGAEPEDDHLPC